MICDLSEYPVSPAVDPALEAAVYGAWDRTRALGVALPKFFWIFVFAPGADSYAQTHVDADRSRHVRVYICDDVPPAQAFEAVLHELRHVADADLIRGGRMSVAALERRAEAFTVWAQLERRLLRPAQTFDQYVELFLPGRCA